MGTEDNKAVLREFFSRLSSGEIDGVMELMHDDAFWWLPGDSADGVTMSKSVLPGEAKKFREIFPDNVQMTVKSMVAEDDRVAAQVESLGRRIDGQVYRNAYHTLCVVRDGRIASIHEYCNTLYAGLFFGTVKTI